MEKLDQDRLEHRCGSRTRPSTPRPRSRRAEPDNIPLYLGIIVLAVLAVELWSRFQ